MRGILKTDINTTRLSGSLANKRDGEFPPRTRPTLQWVTFVQRAIKAALSTSSVMHWRLPWGSSAWSCALYLRMQHLGQHLSISLTLNSWQHYQILNKAHYITRGREWQSEKPQKEINPVVWISFRWTFIQFQLYTVYKYASGSSRKKKKSMKLVLTTRHTFSCQHWHLSFIYPAHKQTL